MPKLDTRLEIHSPGLDLHHSRMNHHKLFMDIVHENIVRFAAFAWDCFERHGRGAIFVTRQCWMEMVKSNGLEAKYGKHLPFDYVKEGDSVEEIDLKVLGAGYAEMVRRYDPEGSMVLLVHHYPGDLLSCYWIFMDPTPPEADLALQR